MFSLPKKFIFGNQPKLDFKLSHTDGIARLYTERRIPYHDSKYWSNFLRFDSPADIFSLLSLADIRKAKQNAPENITTLVRVMVAHLESLLNDPQFCPPLPLTQTNNVTSALMDPASWTSSLASSLGFESQQARGSENRDRINEALNVIRVLTRTLPAVMESQDADFEAQILWSPLPPNDDKDAAAAVESQFVIQDQDLDTDKDKDMDDEADPLQAAAAQAEDRRDQQKQEPDAKAVSLGERLIRLTIDLLFCSGFTIPWTEDRLTEASQSANPDRINYAIWQPGVGSSVNLETTTRQHVSNRVEVLRLLLVLLSKSIYIPAHQQHSTADLALKFTIQDLERGIVLPLLCSLLNTSISNGSTTFTSTWLGLPNVGGLVGSSNLEAPLSLVSLCLQMLTILITVNPAEPEQQANPSTLDAAGTAASPNVFHYYLSKLHRAADFDFLWNGMAKTLDEHTSSSIQILAIPIPTGGPGRRAADTKWHLAQVAERLILLWTMLQYNPKFRLYVLDHPQRAPALLSYLLYFSLTYRENLALQGLVRLCAFLLQDVSSESAFAIQLSKPASASKVPLAHRLGLVGGSTAIDFLVQGVYLLIATTKGQLSSLYAPLAITLSNTSPFWRSLSIASSTKVMHLLRSFSQPSFLLSDEGNPRLAYYLLETVNSVLVHQYNSNPNFVYSLILSHKLIEALEEFSLRRGVQEVWNRRRSLGTDTRDWFENAPKLEKPCTSEVTEEDQPVTEQGSIKSAVEKGKMRRISTSSSSSSSSSLELGNITWQGELSKYPIEAVENVATKYIGKNGFRPTQSWVESWKSGLPLSTSRLVIDKLLPQVELIAKGGGSHNNDSSGNPSETDSVTTTAIVSGGGGGGGNTDQMVLAFLRDQEMNASPPPERIHTRPWQWTNQAIVWLRSYLWGTIYVSALLPYGVWADTRIRLFRICERPDPRSISTSTSTSVSTQATLPPTLSEELNVAQPSTTVSLSSSSTPLPATNDGW